MPTPPWKMAVAAFALALAVACNGEPPAAATPGASPSAAPPPTRFGVAGLVPASFPGSTAADWEKLFASFAATGGLAGVYTNWADSAASAGQVPAAIEAAFAAGRAHRFTPLAVLGITREGQNGAVSSTVDWFNPAERQAFVAVAAEVARRHHPAYLGLGNEVNRLYESDLDAFEAFVDAYTEAYGAIKLVSPATQVFTTFQLEMVLGEAFLAGGSEAREPQWRAVHRFHGRLDVAGFTSYPFLDFRTPAEIPADYYAHAAEFAGVPIALTEIGWPSAALGGGVEDAFGGSPGEQAEFVRRLPALLAGVDVRLALWAFPHDVGAAAGPLFGSVALRENGGAEKPALAEWMAIAR